MGKENYYTTCKICGVVKELTSEFFPVDAKRLTGFRLAKCKECLNKSLIGYNRERDKKPERGSVWKRKHQPEKYLARARLNAAVISGKILKPNQCEACGTKEKLHGHHDDYTKPFLVKWLCHECHKKEHRRPIKRAHENYRPRATSEGDDG